MVGSAWGLGEQAWRTDHQRRWNVFALVAAYVAFVIVSVIQVSSRVFSVKRSLRSMPKPYMPTKSVDTPRRVADLVSTEYSRTSVIAHLAQATTGQQEGWGRPGTKWADVNFRSYILSTLDEMRECEPARL
ncbi:hypothetical protein VHUM_02810 [Vanrija humicola]|uniref:Defect at low temperature protein 1 n=1 Tax=Vanrija humicola TaxID=5417 RepID=A0A7D8Z214_VANHU|nr:hypothetical protein VHUM_02810 [Vanrija humicola]